MGLAVLRQIVAPRCEPEEESDPGGNDVQAIQNLVCLPRCTRRSMWCAALAQCHGRLSCVAAAHV